MEAPEERATSIYKAFIKDRYEKMKPNYLSEQALHNLFTAYIDLNDIKLTGWEKNIAFDMIYRHYTRDVL